MRHLAAFFALGALLLLGKRSLDAHVAAQPRPLVVAVPASATPPEVERAIDDAVLIEEALARGGAMIDPLVREQLLRSMRVGGADETSEEELLDRALALGVHRADPVVRQRLVFQARQLLRENAKVPEPSRGELTAYLHAHAARYRRDARASFAHVFLSRAKRGAALERDAQALAHELTQQKPDEETLRLSDPTLWPLRIEEMSEAELDARFGPAFGRAVLSAPLGAFHGPVLSSYGYHFVFVQRRSDARTPTLEEVEPRVRADHAYDASERALEQHIRALRASYSLSVRREGR